MKKLALIIIGLLIINVASVAQEEENEEKDVKTGWNFGPLPTITYNSDLGFQYRVLLDIYNYGDGALYPNYYERY